MCITPIPHLVNIFTQRLDVCLGTFVICPQNLFFFKIYFLFFYFYSYFFILGCIRSYLRRAGFSLMVAHRLQSTWALQFAARRLSSGDTQAQ